MKDRSDDPSHHERTLLPWSYISLRPPVSCIYFLFAVCGGLHLKENKNLFSYFCVPARGPCPCRTLDPSCHGRVPVGYGPSTRLARVTSHALLTWKYQEREMFYLTTHSTHFIYGYMASDIWLRTILIVRKETCCRHIGYSFRLTARVLLYAPSHRDVCFAV